MEENDALLAQLEGEEQAIKDELDQNDAELQQIEAEIQQYYQQYQQQSSGQSTQNQGQATTPVYQGGRYVWPTPGFTSLSSTWGEGVTTAPSTLRVPAFTARRWWRRPPARWCMQNPAAGAAATALILSLITVAAGPPYTPHLSGVVVTTGQTVQQGQLIGYVGNTGRFQRPAFAL